MAKERIQTKQRHDDLRFVENDMQFVHIQSPWNLCMDFEGISDSEINLNCCLEACNIIILYFIV